jgi:hypothetical protein
MLQERFTTREGTCGTAAFRRERVITEDIARARNPNFAIRHEREGQRANETRVRLKTEWLPTMGYRTAPEARAISATTCAAECENFSASNGLTLCTWHPAIKKSTPYSQIS